MVDNLSKALLRAVAEIRPLSSNLCSFHCVTPAALAGARGLGSVPCAVRSH